MAVRERWLERIAQPQEAAQIDRSNPLADGLRAYLYPPAGLLDLATGEAWTTWGTAPTVEAGAYGLCIDNTAAAGGLLFQPSASVASAAQTHLLVVESVSVSGAYAGLLAIASADGSGNSLAWQRDGGNSTWVTYPGPDTLAGSLGAAFGPTVLAITGDGSGCALWIGGQLAATNGTVPTSQADSRIVLFGERNASTTYSIKGRIYGYFGFTRRLTDAELSELTCNPYRLIEPRRILVPVSTGGGVTIDAATGAASAAGIGAGVASPVTISAGAGQAAASGIGASVASPQTVAASTGAANAAGIDASVASPITIQAAAGSAAAAGRQAGVSSGASISAATGAASAIGISAGVASPITVASSVGAASGTGLGASVSSGNQIAATTGAASAAGLSASISSPQTVSAATGLASAAGLQAGVGTGTTIPAALGAASALGLTATVTAATHIVAAVGAAAAAGLGASVRNDGDAPSAPSSRRIAAASVLRSIVGPAANRRIQ